MRIEDLGPNDVVHCDTEEKAISFCEMMNHLGMTWGTGDRYTDKNFWSQYKKDTCYLPKKSEFCSLKYYKNNKKNIIPFEQIEAPKGMFVPGIYWHHSDKVEVVYLETMGQMEALSGYCELVHQCNKPKSNMVKWTPSLEIPKEFWVKLGTSFEKFYGYSVSSTIDGVYVNCGKQKDTCNFTFLAENIYVQNI